MASCSETRTFDADGADRRDRRSAAEGADRRDRRSDADGDGDSVGDCKKE